jgi:hypothetical protein
MKKIKIISVIGSVALLLLLNFSIISRNGKVDEMYGSVKPELASADGQCKYLGIFNDCYCEVGTTYCIAAYCTGGAICSTDIVVEE